MSSSRSFLGPKPVLDADNEPIGRIAGAERDPVTRVTVSFLVAIDPLQADDEDEAAFCWLPADQVRGIRRDRIELNERRSTILPSEDGRRGAHHSIRR